MSMILCLKSVSDPEIQALLEDPSTIEEFLEAAE